MPYCSRCGTSCGLFSSRAFIDSTMRCDVCEIELSKGLRAFQAAFLDFAADGILTAHEWKRLTALASESRVSLGEALSYISSDVESLIKRVVELTYDDGHISHDEERYIEYLMELLQVSPEFVETIRAVVVDLGLSYSRKRNQNRSKIKSYSSDTPRPPHEVLRVEIGASRECLVAAYRAMAKLYHPDKVASLAPEFRELAETKMREINHAYEVLMKSGR